MPQASSISDPVVRHSACSSIRDSAFQVLVPNSPERNSSGLLTITLRPLRLYSWGRTKDETIVIGVTGVPVSSRAGVRYPEEPWFARRVPLSLKPNVLPQGTDEGYRAHGA